MSKAMLPCVLVLSSLPSFVGAQPAKPAFAGKPLEHWVGLLKHDNPLLREEAVTVLGEMGSPAREALPELRPLLKADSRPLRLRTAIALWKIERQSKDVLPVFLDTLKDENRARRILALQMMTQMSTAAVSAAPALVALLDDTETAERNYVTAALREMRTDVIPALIDGLKRPSAQARHDCVQLLHQFSSTSPKVADALAERLKDDDKKVRLEAARALLLSVAHRKAVVAALSEAIKDSDAQHRRFASSMVFTVLPRPRELLEVFAGLLDDPDPQVAGNAALAVWEFTKDAKRVVPTLNRLLKEPNGTTHFSAINTLRQMGPAALPCLPALLNSPSSDTGSLVYIVQQIGPPALPHLIAAANVNSPNRRKAVEALGSCGPEALPQLLKFCQESDNMVRDGAFRSLGALGPRAKEALPLLLKAAKEERGFTRATAIATLGRLGVEAKPAVPLLLEALKDKDLSIQYAAISSLALIPLDPKTAVPALDEAMKDSKNSFLLIQAAQLRLKLDPEPGPVVPVLTELLKDNASQPQAVSILGQIGPKAKDALPALLDLVREGRATPYSRVPIITALVQIDPEGKTIAPALVKLVGDGDRGVRLAALNAVTKIGAECDVAPVLPELRTTEVLQRQAVHQAFRQLGPKAKGATATLLEMVRNPGNFDRLEIAHTLCKVAPEHAELGKRVLLDALGDGPTTRLDVARSLLSVDSANERALKAFEAALTDEMPARRHGALSVLSLADPSAKTLLPQVKRLLKDDQVSIRVLAARAYTRLGGESAPAVEVLTAALQDREAMSWHGSVAFYLGDLGPDAKSAVPALLALLAERPALRSNILPPLRKIDPEAAKKAEAP